MAIDSNKCFGGDINVGMCTCESVCVCVCVCVRARARTPISKPQNLF